MDTNYIRLGPTEFRLIKSDCIVGMQSMAAESVDVVVTSPPYNLGIKYKNYEDNRSREDYLAWSLRWVAEVKRVLKADGSFFLNVGSAPSDPLMPYELVVELKKSGLVLQNTFHWIKSITVQPPTGPAVSAGHFKPINSKRYVTDCHEFVFQLTKQGNVEMDRFAVGVPYTHKSNIARWSHTGGRDVRCRGNTWFIPYKTIVSRAKQRPHPATFPVALATQCIKIHGLKEGLTVMDPFVGIGHAALAARDCKVHQFIGFDIDESYLETARSVLEL